MRRVFWDDDMVAALVDMRARGLAVWRCAVRIGVIYRHALAKAHELGVGTRRTNGAKIGRPRIFAEPMTAAERMQRTRDRRRVLLGQTMPR
jgi:hypothetical protein